MSSKWRPLQTSIEIEEPDDVDNIVKCICLLHNIIIEKEEAPVASFTCPFENNLWHSFAQKKWTTKRISNNLVTYLYSIFQGCLYFVIVNFYFTYLQHPFPLQLSTKVSFARHGGDIAYLACPTVAYSHVRGLSVSQYPSEISPCTCSVGRIRTTDPIWMGSVRHSAEYVVCSRRVPMPLHIMGSVGRIRPYTGDDLLGRIRFQWTTGLLLQKRTSVRVSLLSYVPITHLPKYRPPMYGI
jgi:hypothetical protein